MAVKNHENAITDRNYKPALTAHSGTAGTALTKRITSQNTVGAVDVHTAGETARSAIVAFVTDVPTAATRVQLASNSIAGGIVQAPSTNVGNVYVGGSDVSSTVFGVELQPGQMAGFAGNNTNLMYIDAATNGDDVSFFGS